jgi:glycosyltransferase involved in cell wall biosynthesis
MPAFNVGPFVEKAIESILQQTYTNFELLITDDGSTDDTLHKIRKYSDARIKLFQNQPNKGYLQTTNELFKQAKGDLVTFQDADDWSHPSRIRSQVDQFLANSNLGLCTVRSRTEITVDGLFIDSPAVFADSEIREYEKTNLALPFTCGTIMIARHVLEAVGPYRPYFDRIGAEHVDWAYLIFEKFRCANVGPVLYHYRFNKGSFSKSSAGFDVRKKYSLGLARLFFDQRKKYGVDDLMSGDLTRTNSWLMEIEKKYSLDRSLWGRETATNFLNQRLYGDALREASTTLQRDPWNIRNMQLVLWIVARSTYRSVVKLF